MEKNIREIIRNSGITQWRIAEKMGISEYTLSRYLRHEPKDEQRKLILAALEELLREETGERIEVIEEPDKEEVSGAGTDSAEETEEEEAKKQQCYFRSINDTAYITGLAPGFLRRGVRDGTVPHIKNGARYMINVPLLIEQMNQRMRKMQA